MNQELKVIWTEEDAKAFEELAKRHSKFQSMKRVAAKKVMDRHLIGFFSKNSEHVPQAMLQAVTEYGPELVKVLDEIGVKFPAKPLAEEEIQWVCLTDGDVGVMIRDRIYVCYKAESLLVTGRDGQRYWVPNKRELGESLQQPLYVKWRRDHEISDSEARESHLQYTTPWRDDSFTTSPVNPLPIPTLNPSTSEE